MGIDRPLRSIIGFYRRVRSGWAKGRGERVRGYFALDVGCALDALWLQDALLMRAARGV